MEAYFNVIKAIGEVLLVTRTTLRQGDIVLRAGVGGNGFLQSKKSAFR